MTRRRRRKLRVWTNLLVRYYAQRRGARAHTVRAIVRTDRRTWFDSGPWAVPDVERWDIWRRVKRACHRARR